MQNFEARDNGRSCQRVQCTAALPLAALACGARRRRGSQAVLGRSATVLVRAEAPASTGTAAPAAGNVPAVGEGPDARARIAKRVDDVVIVVASPLGEGDEDRLPDVGDSVRFSGGAVGHVIALSDLCFAAALGSTDDEAAEGESYTILPKALKPTVAVPEGASALIDARGEPLSAEAGAAKAEQARVGWFGEIVTLIRRQRIDTPLHAGVAALDSFVPIGGASPCSCGCRPTRTPHSCGASKPMWLPRRAAGV